MAANAYRRCPVRYQTWYIGHNNRLAENGAIQYITDSTVWRFPHLLQVKLLNTGLIGCNGSTFYAYTILFNSIGSINSYLVVCFITIFQSQVVILNINVKVRDNQFIFYK